MNQPSPNLCPRCGASFACGMQTGSQPCWCAELPVLRDPPQQVPGCYCPTCLRQLLEHQPEPPASS